MFPAYPQDLLPPCMPQGGAKSLRLIGSGYAQYSDPVGISRTSRPVQGQSEFLSRTLVVTRGVTSSRVAPLSCTDLGQPTLHPTRPRLGSADVAPAGVGRPGSR